ncbi:MAG: type 1 glutamine amidotransferase domain-containing protein [Solirubrobacterales bacterium]|nr:DJ-1/PfpI family protein [Solirubrobacterales bacterium]
MTPTIHFLLPASDYDPTESGLPWRALRDAGVDVRFATPDGEPAYADRRLTDDGFSLLSPFLMTKRGPLDAYREMAADAAFLAPSRHDEVVLGDDDGILVPGGHAKGVRTLIESEPAQGLVADAMGRDLPLGAVCHGVLLLARATDPETGRSPLHGRRTTALTESMELTAWNLTRAWLRDYYRTYPETVQAEVTAALADPSDFDAGPRLPRRDSPERLDLGFTVRDRNYLSARWPGDCHRFGLEFAALVDEHSRSPVARATNLPSGQE